ncbi:calcium-dependent protein kinase 9-like [Phragmites australis]|uniref:calcium-dependent protein kinase 9-like n=1 Tax=Phragmites australis TaxID=29695 RepID=UPI002D778DEB|nr:calcium-dependent protein kinase 9-like [Phragmites australis]
MGNASCRAWESASAVPISHSIRQSQPQPEAGPEPRFRYLRTGTGTEVPYYDASRGGAPRIHQKYRLGQELGRGGSGAMMRVAFSRRAGARRKLACKTIPRTPDVNFLEAEMVIMASLPCHPFLVRLHEVYLDDIEVHLVMELCDGGSLSDWISGSNLEAEVAMEAWAVAEAVRALHKAGVMHRDLKPDNMMFGQDGLLKVIDFGLSVFFRRLPSSGSSTLIYLHYHFHHQRGIFLNHYGNPIDHEAAVFTGIVGTLPYTAPEVLAGKRYGLAADVWSAGVIIYEMLCNYRPFEADTEDGLRQAILSGAVDVRRHPWQRISNQAKSLVLGMLEIDPSKRFTAEEVLGTLRLEKRTMISPFIIWSIRLQQFSTMNKFKKKAMRVIAADALADESGHTDDAALNNVLGWPDKFRGVRHDDESRDGLEKASRQYSTCAKTG